MNTSAPSAPVNSPLFADPIRGHLEKARKQIHQGKLQQAAQTLNQAQRLAPGDARLFMMASLMAEKSGNLPGAFDAMRRCVAVAPNWAPGRLELALLLARHNQFPEALELAQKVAKQEPKNLLVLANVVDIAHRAGHLQMAVEQLRRGLELVPNDPQLRLLLAQDLSALGEHTAAVEQWESLLQEQAQNPHILNGLVQAHLAAGQPAAALPHAKALAELEPDNPTHAYYLALAQGETPAQQPVEISSKLFDNMAPTYDIHMVHQLGYRLPKLVAERIVQSYPDKKLNALDLGCGTGLLGVHLGRLDGFLIGVDVSTKMVEQAARFGVYDRFHTVNIHDALRETPDALYHVLAALDVFIYAGDLSQAVGNAHRILLPGGDFYLSCEVAPEDGPDMVLQTTGRYAHKRSHVQALCEQAGFAQVDIQDVVIRQEGGQAVQGFLVQAHKA